MRGGDHSFLVAELDWDDMVVLRRAFESPEGKATAADVAKLSADGVRSMVYETKTSEPASRVFLATELAPASRAGSARPFNRRDESLPLYTSNEM